MTLTRLASSPHSGSCWRPSRAPTRPTTKSSDFWYGTAADGGPTVRLYYFFSPTCPHCQAAKPFLDEMASRKPWLEIKRYRGQGQSRQRTILLRDGEIAGRRGAFDSWLRVLPAGHDRLRHGGDDGSGPREGPRRLPRGARGESGCRPGADERRPQRPRRPPEARRRSIPLSPGSVVHLPFIGTVNAEALSLPLLTLVLAGMDAFNPCAFFVLLFLLSLLVHAKSRTRMLIVGGTFVLFSGIVYFVFMAAWLNVFLIAGELRVITVIAGLVALTVAALNIKDYFWFKEGPSLSIPDAAKPGLFKRMREVVTTGNMGPMLASTVLLAIVANSYELLCTAGFPMVYTRALTLAKLESWQYYAWLAAYNVIYVLPLLAIVIVFTRTMGARKLSESEGRILKLVSGFMMLGFGLVLLFAPGLLTNPFASILVLVVAVAASVLIAKIAAPRPA